MLEFPYSLIRATSVQMDLAGLTISGGPSANGQQQVIDWSGGGLWVLKLGFQMLRSPDQIRAWRVIQYGGRGGARRINITLCEIRQAPAIPGVSFTGVPHSDGSPFSDGSLYSSHIVGAYLAAPVAEDATAMSIRFDGGNVPLGGEIFSLPYTDENGEDCHEMKVILTVEANPDTAAFDITFLPPMRANHGTDSFLEFEKPKCTMRLSQADSMSITVEQGKRVRSPSATFVEAFS